MIYMHLGIEVRWPVYRKLNYSLHKISGLNENKSEIVLFVPSGFYDLGDLGLGDLSSYVSPCVKNLGVLFDSGLEFDKKN